jgi:hypothetical protein
MITCPPPHAPGEPLFPCEFFALSLLPSVCQCCLVQLHLQRAHRSSGLDTKNLRAKSFALRCSRSPTQLPSNVVSHSASRTKTV